MSIHCVYWLKLDSGMSCQRHFPPIPHTLRTYARTSCHYDLIFQPKKKPQKYSTCYLQFNQVYMCFWSSAFSPFKSCSKLPFHAHISNKFMDSESDVEEEKTHINRFAKKESWRSRLADCRKTKACEMKNRFIELSFSFGFVSFCKIFRIKTDIQWKFRWVQSWKAL